jgi:hypothetical protein
MGQRKHTLVKQHLPTIALFAKGIILFAPDCSFTLVRLVSGFCETMVA